MPPTQGMERIEGMETWAIVAAVVFYLSRSIYELVKGRQASGATLERTIEILMAPVTAALAQLAAAIQAQSGEIRDMRATMDEVCQRTETTERLAGSTKEDTTYIKARLNGSGGK